MNKQAMKLHLDASGITHALNVASRGEVFHGDADLSGWFGRELESVSAQIYEVKHPDLPAAEGRVLPFATDVESGADTFVWYTMDARGIAEFIDVYARHDVPEVELIGAENVGRVQPMRLKYSWTTDDIRRAAKARRSLRTQKAKQCRRGHAERLHITALWGREDIGLPGVLNHPNITIGLAADNGGGSTFFKDKTLQQVTDDIATAVDAIEDTSNFALVANRGLLAPSDYRALARRKLSTGDSGIVSFLAWIESTFGFKFDQLLDLSANRSRGNLDENAMFVYRFDPEVGDLVAPDAYRELAPQLEGYTVIVYTDSSFGGARIKQPLAFYRMDGIGPAS